MRAHRPSNAPIIRCTTCRRSGNAVGRTRRERGLRHACPTQQQSVHRATQVAAVSGELVYLQQQRTSSKKMEATWR